MLRNRTTGQETRGRGAKAVRPFVTGTPGAALHVPCPGWMPSKTFGGALGYRQTGSAGAGILDNRQLQM